MPSDAPVFMEGNAIVTKAMVKIGDVTYPINGIGSVSVRRPDPPKRANGLYVVAAMMIALGIAMALAGILKSNATDAKGGIVILAIGIVLAMVGHRRKLNRSLRHWPFGRPVVTSRR